MPEEELIETETDSIRYITPRASFEVTKSFDIKRTSSDQSQHKLRTTESTIERSSDGLLSFATLLKAKQAQIKRKIRQSKHDHTCTIDHWRFCHEFAEERRVKLAAAREMMKERLESLESEGQKGYRARKTGTKPSGRVTAGYNLAVMAPLPMSSVSSVEDEGNDGEASDWLHVYGSDEVRETLLGHSCADMLDRACSTC